MAKKHSSNPTQSKLQNQTEDHKVIYIPLVVAVISGVFLLIATFLGPLVTDKRHLSATQTADANINGLLLMQTPTIIPFGSEIFEIGFSSSGEGNCNNYDSNKLGYEALKKTYYIIPNKGFVAVCHKDNDLQAAGILQTTAFPDGNPDYFGYAALFGWKGTEKSTTAACGFGVRKNGSKTEALFIQIIGGKWNHITTELKNYDLDINPHSVRVVLYPSGKAIGYLDNNYVAEHTFVDCNSGPVGMIAYGPGDVKINYTSLKLFALP